MITLTARFNNPINAIVKFLDRPTMWILYLILGIYIFFFSLVILRGITKYNRVLDKVSKHEIVSEDQINSELRKNGFRNSFSDFPSMLDYFYAGL